MSPSSRDCEAPSFSVCDVGKTRQCQCFPGIIEVNAEYTLFRENVLTFWTLHVRANIPRMRSDGARVDNLPFRLYSHFYYVSCSQARPCGSHNVGLVLSYLVLLLRIPLHVQTKLVVELQFKDEAGVHGKGGKGNLG